MRLFTACVALVLWLAACSHPSGQPPPNTTTTPLASPASPVSVDPTNIQRVRVELPPDYEVTVLSDRIAPVELWGFGPGWVAHPSQCGVLADPVAGAATTQGWSGSGPGGIVYAIVTGAPPAPVPFDPALSADCGHWTLSAGHTSGTVALVGAPAVDNATTVGMSIAAKTVVEGGTETHSLADTFSAYLGDFVAFVTVVTDPGSPSPPLGREFAAAMLVKTVSALRD